MIPTKKDNPRVPVSPAETIADVRPCLSILVIQGLTPVRLLLFKADPSPPTGPALGQGNFTSGKT